MHRFIKWHGPAPCKPGSGVVKLEENQGVGRRWVGGGCGKSLVINSKLQENFIRVLRFTLLEYFGHDFN